jgi:hypothetical protein
MAIANTIAEIRIMRFIVISPISWDSVLLSDTLTFRFRRKIALDCSDFTKGVFATSPINNCRLPGHIR